MASIEVAASEPCPAALELHGLTKRFGTLTAVDAIDLNVATNGFTTLLGPSGSGKTTTLKLVAGFLRPTSGRVILAGRDATGVPTHKRGVGMVFQNYALFPHLTVGENVAFPLTRVAKAERDTRVREALTMVGLDGFADRFPRQLSGGQQQRVAFARATVYRPKLLLMDEPFGALDKKLRESLQLEVRQLHHELGITVLHVTHDQEEALVLSDRIVIFREGRIEQVGTPEDLYERPRTTFVADFLGDSNIFRGTFSRDGERAAVSGAGWRMAGRCEDGSLQSGTAAALIVRPDKIRFGENGAPGRPGTQRLTGRVRQVVYLGGSLKYELEALGAVVYVRIPAHGSAFAPPPGSEAALEWRSEDGIIVAD